MDALPDITLEIPIDVVGPRATVRGSEKLKGHILVRISSDDPVVRRQLVDLFSHVTHDAYAILTAAGARAIDSRS